MNKKVILATFLFLTSFLKVFCKIDIDDAIVISNETYLSYQLPLGSENITTITFEHYDGSQFQLNLECSNSKNSNSTTCFTTIDDEEKKQMYGSRISINHEPSTNWAMFPTPIISSPFRPPTKGGELVIKGTYLAFSERLYYQIIYPTRQFIILNPRLSFDPTNINVQFPPGCGYQLIKWENNKLYNFSYENPSISNIKTTYSNIIVNGSNFCDKSYPSNITIDGNLIQSPNYEKDQDSIIIKYNEKYSTKSKIIIETSNCTSIETIFEFKPDQLTINSVPTNKGGLILINGIRLSPNPTNKNKNNITIKIGNLTCLNVISISSELISCTLSPLDKSVSNNIKNDLQVSVSINEITNENTLIFNYNIVKLNPIKYSLPNRVLQLNGDCLGSISNTTVYLNGKQVILKDLEINHNETVLTFKIPDEYQSKLNVSVKVNDVMSNEIQIDISFYVSLSNLSPSTFENTNIILTLYNIKPENYNKLPTLIINSEDQIPINGVSLNSTNQEVNSYSFLIPVGCGKKEITIKIGTQSCLSSISYIEPIISNCKVSGYDGKSGDIICVGNFGNENYFSQSYVLFSNNKISPTLNNRTTLSFPLISGYYSDDLIFEMCEISSKSFKLNISPSLKRIDSSNVNTNGGLFYIFGEFFNSNINSTVFCDDNPYQGTFENTTTISFDLPIQGPNDIKCNYSFNNGMNYGDFQVEYPKPIVENISTIYVTGGNLTIYGNNFYNISNITIEVNNQLQCNNIEFINLTTITCNLPPINETSQSAIFNQKLLIRTTTTTFSKKLLLKIIFGSKSWSGNIFQYTKDEIQYNNHSENSSGKTFNDSTNHNNKENKKNGIKMSIKNIVLVCTLVPLSIIVVVCSVMYFLKIRRKRIEQINYHINLKKRNYLPQEQKERNRLKAKEVDDEIQKTIFENKRLMLQYATKNANYKSTVAWLEKEIKKQEESNKDNIEASSSGQNQQQDFENKNETTSQLPSVPPPQPPPQLQPPSSPSSSPS
ncbi:hypothetical protein ACTFIY_008694 [Dictyostelium cf. discoideum]